MVGQHKQDDKTYYKCHIPQSNVGSLSSDILSIYTGKLSFTAYKRYKFTLITNRTKTRNHEQLKCDSITVFLLKQDEFKDITYEEGCLLQIIMISINNQQRRCEWIAVQLMYVHGGYILKYDRANLTGNILVLTFF